MVDMLRVHNTEHRLLCLLQMLTEIIHTGIPDAGVGGCVTRQVTILKER